MFRNVRKRLELPLKIHGMIHFIRNLWKNLIGKTCFYVIWLNMASLKTTYTDLLITDSLLIYCPLFITIHLLIYAKIWRTICCENFRTLFYVESFRENISKLGIELARFNDVVLSMYSTKFQWKNKTVNILRFHLETKSRLLHVRCA